MNLSEEIAQSLRTSIAQKVTDKDIAIAFSGGLDSGLIAAIAKDYAKSVTLYTVGSDDSFDSIEADKGAKKLGLDVVHIELDDMIENVAEMVNLTDTTDPVTVSFEIPLFYVCKNCDQKIVLTGQGADEMFGGYSKYVGLDEKGFTEQRRKDIMTLFQTTIEHENKVTKHFGKEAFYPYLDPKVLDSMSAFEPKELMPGELRKEKLREIAKMFGQDYFAGKRKKAAQYGSGANDMLREIARSKGLSTADLISGLRS